jgi:enamine deaminase RidA (YjgF/YER057c/UK114 family)
MRTCCESAGSGLDRIVKMTVVLADSRVYDEMNRVVAEILPCRSAGPHNLHVAA